MPEKSLNQFRDFIAQKAIKQHQNIALRNVHRKMDIARSTLNSWANNQVTRYDTHVILELCEWFDCHVGD